MSITYNLYNNIINSICITKYRLLFDFCGILMLYTCINIPCIKVVITLLSDLLAILNQI